MASRLTVRNRILDDIDRGSLAAARVDLAILDAIKFYRAERFTWNQKRKVFTISASQEFTSLTANWIEIDSLQIQVGNDRRQLTEKTWKWIESRVVTSTDVDEPIFYATQYNQLRLWLRPDSTYSYAMAYVHDLVAGVSSLSDSFSTGWLNEGEQMIRLRAQGDVLINYIKGPEAASDGAACLAQADQIKDQLRRRKNRADGGGMIEAWL